MVSDFLAGHFLQSGSKATFLTGTDEHGQKIEKAAAANSISPQEHCDRFSNDFKELWDLLEINYSHFVRTSNPEHQEFVKTFFDKVNAKGDIYKANYEGLYCVDCEDFKLEKDLEKNEDGELMCPIHKKKVENYAQENYFFKLSKYEQALKDYIKEHPDFIAPDYRKNEVLSWLEDGLRDFPISRVNLDWGINIPGDDNQKIYVWFDALLSYISGLKTQQSEVWADETQITHIIGKDILRFHAIYWPAMLMSAEMPLPDKVFGHGFLTKDGHKMGKTLGNVIEPAELVREYGSDAVRFFFIRDFPFGRDGDFSHESFKIRLNSDLANNLGNLLSRCANLYRKNFKDITALPEIESAYAQLLQTTKEKFVKNIANINTFVAFEELFSCLSKFNVYINDKAPWKLLKTEVEADEQEALKVIYTSLEAVRQVAIMLAAVCPNISIEILKQLGVIKPENLATLDNESVAKIAEQDYSLDKLDFRARREHLLTEIASFANLECTLDIKSLQTLCLLKGEPAFSRLA
jgi:methionyl-tRNA synthetase